MATKPELNYRVEFCWGSMFTLFCPSCYIASLIVAPTYKALRTCQAGHCFYPHSDLLLDTWFPLLPLQLVFTLAFNLSKSYGISLTFFHSSSYKPLQEELHIFSSACQSPWRVLYQDYILDTRMCPSALKVVLKNNYEPSFSFGIVCLFFWHCPSLFLSRSGLPPGHPEA